MRSLRQPSRRFPAAHRARRPALPPGRPLVVLTTHDRSHSSRQFRTTSGEGGATLGVCGTACTPRSAWPTTRWRRSCVRTSTPRATAGWTVTSTPGRSLPRSRPCSAGWPTPIAGRAARCTSGAARRRAGVRPGGAIHGCSRASSTPGAGGADHRASGRWPAPWCCYATSVAVDGRPGWSRLAPRPDARRQGPRRRRPEPWATHAHRPGRHLLAVERPPLALRHPQPRRHPAARPAAERVAA